MKKIILILLVTGTIVFSCKKDSQETTKNLCPIIVENLVPQVVKDSFAVRYPATIVTTWFYKDSSSYCALFTVTTVQKLAQFATNGTFIKEDIETHQEGEHQDSTGTSGKTSTGCECETHKEGD